MNAVTSLRWWRAETVWQVRTRKRQRTAIFALTDALPKGPLGGLWGRHIARFEDMEMRSAALLLPYKIGRRLSSGVLCALALSEGTVDVNATQSDPSSEIHLCRNSANAADKIAHCSNVISHSTRVATLVTAYNSRGLALTEIGRFGDAIADFNFVISHSPRIAGFSDNRQTAHRLSGQLEQALADANKAIDLAPTYPFVFRGRANVYNAMGKFDLAVQDYNEAIRVAPEDGGLLIDRGKTLRSLSKFDQAVADFSHALDLDKSLAAAYRERGITYKLEGRSQEAIADLTIYDRLQPGDQEVDLAYGKLEVLLSRLHSLKMHHLRRARRSNSPRAQLSSLWSKTAERLRFRLRLMVS
jgi:tetratricopeptide (TPR) repeat protein